MTAAILTAVYLGLLCSISPCPLATNIAAVSFIGRKTGKPPAVFCSGIFYALGRLPAFCVLGLVLGKMLDSAPMISHGLQKYMNLFLGPCMILIAMVLLDLLKLPGWLSLNVNSKHLNRLEKFKFSGAVLLGILFALSFCPTSAVLYFGSLLPLAMNKSSLLLFSGIFGVASCLPVLGFAFILAFASQKLAGVYNAVGKLERWARWITGGIFLLIGFYFTLQSLLQ